MKKRLKFKNEIMDTICDINFIMIFIVAISKGTILFYPTLVCIFVSMFLMIIFGGLFSSKRINQTLKFLVLIGIGLIICGVLFTY